MPSRIHRWIGLWVVAASVAVVVLIGCQNKQDNPSPKTGSNGNLKTLKKIDNGGNEITPITGSRELAVLPFKDAIYPDSPEDIELLDLTCTGKSVGVIYEAVAKGGWDKVIFKNENGKRINYQAVIKTDLGEIHAELLSDDAPNHVRNFIALARTGYFDGMSFYYSQNVKVEEGVSAYIETGSPKGTSEVGCGSIGYWLKQEISERLTHDEGTLGACIEAFVGGPNLQTKLTACRFYITAEKMPQADTHLTIFGKVTRGLDIVRTINKRAVYDDPADSTKQNHLKEPVLIRSVTIQNTEG